MFSFLLNIRWLFLAYFNLLIGGPFGKIFTVHFQIHLHDAEPKYTFY